MAAMFIRPLANISSVLRSRSSSLSFSSDRGAPQPLQPGAVAGRSALRAGAADGVEGICAGAPASVQRRRRNLRHARR